MSTTIQLPRPLWYQKPVIDALEDEQHKYITFLASRRIGKSLLAKCMAIKWAGESRCNIGFVCPTGDLCRKFIKEIVTILQGSGIIAASNSVDKFIQFCNGSMIYFHALEAFSRGAGNYKYMVFDECAFLDNDIYESVFKPMTMEATKIYFCSTPCGPAGVFYENYMRGKAGEGNKRYISFKCTLEESGLYPDEEVEEIKRTTPSLIYEQEYNCKFVSGGISAFKDFNKHLTKAPAEKTPHLYAGIDFSGASGGIDSTVLTIVNDRNETVLLKLWQNGDLKTLNEMADLLNLYNVREAFAEENSMGAISIQLLKKKYKRIVPFVTSNSSKREIVENVMRNFEQGKGSLIDSPAVRSQMSNFVMVRTKGGKITYQNLNKAIHDDIPMSYSLASWCCHQNEKKGRYCLA